MSLIAGDVVNYDLKSGKRDRLVMQARATITGGAGVVVAPLTASDDPGITITRGGSAGLYLLTFPKSADALGSLNVLLLSPAGTVKGWYATVADFNAGTASIQLVNAAGASTDPAAADSFIVTIFVSMRKDF